MNRITLYGLLAVPLLAGIAPAQEPAGVDRPTGLVDRKACAGCHAEVKTFAVAHGPVQIDGCVSCHRVDSAENHTFTVPEQVCLQCHDSPSLDGSVAHDPVASGACLDCHDPHGGADRAMLGNTSINELCLGCHDDVKTGDGAVHASATSCTSCHRPHSAEYPSLLRGAPPGLCLDCHTELRKTMETAPVGHPPASDDRACQDCHDVHGSTHGKLLVSGTNTLCLGCHDDVAGGTTAAHALGTSCTGCHVAHAGQQPMLLRQAAPGLCFTCHESMGKKVEPVRVNHAPMGGEQACWNCHTVHTSKHPTLLVEEVNTLCLGCHDRKLVVAKGDTVADIKAQLEGAAHVHEPVAGEDCTVCHDSHGSEYVGLLNSAYPDGYLADFKEENYALCFGCHDAALAMTDSTTTATGFRDAELNLHHLHLKKRRTCLVCHFSHAGSDDRLVRSEVSFGKRGYKMSLVFERSDGGGTCAKSCHAKASYHRGLTAGERKQ